MKMKAACIQLTSGDDIAANITRVEKWAAKAAKAGADLIALPENAFLMERSGAARVLYAQDEHPAVAACARIAKAHKRWLLAGSVAVKVDGSGKTANRSLLFTPGGEVAAHYDKIHLFDVEVGDGQTYKESARIVPGSEAVVTKTPWGKLGMTVCYDVRFPQLYRTLAEAGAEMIAVPAAFTQVTGKAHWHVLLRARAIENGCFVIAPAQTGTHPGGRKTYGHSLIVDPWGEVLADGGTKEGVVMADIDMAQVRKVRAKIPSLAHDRGFKLLG